MNNTRLIKKYLTKLPWFARKKYVIKSSSYLLRKGINKTMLLENNINNQLEKENLLDALEVSNYHTDI